MSLLEYLIIEGMCLMPSHGLPHWVSLKGGGGFALENGFYFG